MYDTLEGCKTSVEIFIEEKELYAHAQKIRKIRDN